QRVHLEQGDAMVLREVQQREGRLGVARRVVAAGDPGGMGGGQRSRPVLRLERAIPNAVLGLGPQRPAGGQVHVIIPYLIARRRSRRRCSRWVPLRPLGFSPPSWSFGISSHFSGSAISAATSSRISTFSSGSRPFVDTGMKFPFASVEPERLDSSASLSGS